MNPGSRINNTEYAETLDYSMAMSPYHASLTLPLSTLISEESMATKLYFTVIMLAIIVDFIMFPATS